MEGRREGGQQLALGEQRGNPCCANQTAPNRGQSRPHQVSGKHRQRSEATARCSIVC